MHQVRLAQAYTAIKEQRVVAVLGVVGHLPGRGARQLVRLAFDKGFEGEGAVQVAGVLERTFDLNGALFGTPAGSGCRVAVGHGIEAVPRGRLGAIGHQHRFDNAGHDRLGNGCGRRIGGLGLALRERRCHCSTDRGVGRSARRRAATAAY